MKNLFILSCLSLTLGYSAQATATETVRCSLKTVHAGEKIVSATEKYVSVLVDENEGELNVVLNKTTGENIDLLLETKENVQGLYGVSLRHWPTGKTDPKAATFGDVLLMSEGKTDASKATLSLHPHAQMRNSLSALFITNKALLALRDLGYKGSSLVNNFTNFNAIDNLVDQALAQGKLQKTDLALIGLEGNCVVK